MQNRDRLIDREQDNSYGGRLGGGKIKQKGKRTLDRQQCGVVGGKGYKGDKW